MWLYILIGVVLVMIVFLLGSYSARTKAITKGQIQTAACGDVPTEPQETSGTGSCVFANDTPKPCKKHRRRKCNVCHSDGFSTDAAFLSNPAPF
jgi:hypothetical protein